MSRIGLLLLLQTGVIPVLSQYNSDYRYTRYADYNDYQQDVSSEAYQRQDSSVGLQQASFFDSSDVSALGVNKGYGGLTPPPPPPGGLKSGKNLYFSNSERRAIVPSSLRELEESYIRSLSSPAKTQPGLDPYGENGPSHFQLKQKNAQGVEQYSGFIMAGRGFDKDEMRAQLRASQIQSAPITYGFPLLTQQISASNSIDDQFARQQKLKERGKVYDYRDKNVVPRFPDLDDRPPVPQEPDLPSEEMEDALEEATRKPPIKILPTPANIQNFFQRPPPPPLASPPSIFDPTFPEPVLQRGFIPSFGPPTKEPFLLHHHPPPDKAFANVLHEPVYNHLPSHAPPHAEITTTSPVPVLRPEYPVKDKDDLNYLPDEVSSVTPGLEVGPKEGTIFKHISVHVPSEDLDEEVSSPKVVKVQKKPEKHIKVIFIRPPDTPTPKTEVQVPPTPQQKTLVYVLSESGGVRTPIKLVTPNPLKPAPPQVFFLRYTDPTVEASQPPPSTTTSKEREPSFGSSTEKPNRTSPPPPIKQLASPHDPDAELLRSAPVPVLPTYSSFNSPSSTPVSRLAIQTLNAPTTYTTATANTKINDYESNNNLGDPTNGRYQGAAESTNSALSHSFIPNINRLTPPQYNSNNFNNFLPVPSSSIASSSQQQQAPTTEPNSQNRYSTLYHLYPPPVGSPNLFQLYFNQINHPRHPQYYPYLRDQVNSGSSSAPSSIQGLYTVAPYLKDLPGSVNFNSLAQNPDGKNLPRSTRNYVMMTYAPKYMPSASEHVPIFTSPADFLKSLLGDSYMYYNSLRNKSEHISSDFLNLNSLSSPSGPTLISTTTTTTTPAPPPVTKPQAESHFQPQRQAQHHTFPLILNLEDIQNLSRPNSQQQPFTILIGNPYGLSSQTSNANIQIRNPTLTAAAAAPINFSSFSQLVPPFLLSSTTTTTTSTTPQPRISWTPPTSQPPPSPQVEARKQTVQLPIVIYDSKANAGQAPPQSMTTEESVASHFNNLFRNFHENPAQIPKTNKPASQESSETSSEYTAAEDSSSVNSGETSEVYSGSNESGGSGEEIVPIYFEATKDHQKSNTTSSIIYVKNNSTTITANLSNHRPPKRSGRKRVNPANVKPGRRLRKVKKPPKSNTRAKDPNPDNLKSNKTETHTEPR